MRRIALLLLSVVSLQAAVTVSALSVDGLSHSNLRVTFNVSATYDHLQLRYIKNSLGTCTAGTGGQLLTIQYFGGVAPPGFLRTSGMSLDVGGLEANTLYNFCPEASDNGGVSYSSGVSVPATTLALPNPHPVLPTPPATFDTSYPNTSGFSVVTTNANCSDLQAKITAAMNNQLSTGTVIQIPAGSTCTFGYGALAGVYQILHDAYSPDLITWLPANVTTGNPGRIALTPLTLIEGQMVQFGNHGFSTPPASNSCPNGNGLVSGGKYWVHLVGDGTHINLFCPNGDGTGPSATLMEFTTIGSGAPPMELAPFTAVTSNKCPSTDGPKTCTYQDRSLLHWIVVRSSAPDLLLPPDGVRTNPNWFSSGLGVTLVNPIRNIGSTSSDHIFLSFGRADGNEQNMAAKIHWGPGIQVTNEVDPGFGTYTNLTVTPETTSQIVIDRMHLHGGGTPQRWGNVGLPANVWDGLNFGFVNNFLDNQVNWHANNLSDGSTTIMSRGLGPQILYNNWIEGAGIPIHIDGGGGTTWGTADVSLIRNTFYSPEKYRHGSPVSDGNFYGFRQPFEIKQCQRCLLGGNVFNGAWSENTAASVFNAFTAVGGLSILDTTLYSNSYINGPGGVNIPVIVDGGVRINVPPNRFSFINNLLIGIKSSQVAVGGQQAVARGWVFEGPIALEDVTIKKNTIVGNTGTQPSIFFFQDSSVEGLDVENNFFTGLTAPEKGAFIDGSVATNVCSGLIGQALTTCKVTGSGTPLIFANNVLMSTDGSNQGTVQGWWPLTASYVPASMNLSTAPGWINYDSTGLGGSYGLKSTSGYRSGLSLHGTDGTDIGIDEAKLLRDQGHARFVSVTNVAANTATVNFVAPDVQSCPVRIALTSWSPAVPTSGVVEFTDTGTAAGPRSVNITGLTTDTVYYGIVLCAVEQPTFQFHTKSGGVTFNDFTAGMVLQRDWEFGTAGGRNVTNISDLSVDFVPYGIAGTTPINQEWERYQVPPYPGTFNTTNFVFTTNTLDLTATIPGGGGLFNGGINSGQIFTKATWNPHTSGKTYAFEGRLKIPPNLQGMWPAFWLYPPAPGTSDASEIDIFEFYKMTGFDGHNWTGNIHGPGVGSTIYQIPGFGPPCGGCWTPGTDFSAAFHLYQLVWTPTQEYHFVDGVLVLQRFFTYTAPGPAGLIVNLAVGSDLPGLPGLQPTSLGEFPMQFSIDHIKQWSTP